MEEPAVPVRPIHHRRDAKPKYLSLQHFFFSLDSLGRVVCTHFYALVRPFSRQFDRSVNTERTRFGDVHEAEIGILASPGEAERKICQRDIPSPQGRRGMGTRGRARIDRGEPALVRGSRETKTFVDLIQLHREDLLDVGKRIGRSKSASLAFLERRLDRLRIPELDRERLIQFGKERAREGAGPVTLGIDLGYIKTILSHAAAVHGVIVSIEPIALARIALARLGLVGKRNERERRPTQDELNRLIAAFDANRLQQFPVGRIIRIAVATAMSQDEICRIEWSDFDPHKKMLLIRDRKDPRRKSGNNQRIPLLEHFPIGLNRRGFPNQHLSDSSCMLVLEARMHGQSPFERSSAACHCGN